MDVLQETNDMAPQELIRTGLVKLARELNAPALDGLLPERIGCGGIRNQTAGLVDHLAEFSPLRSLVAVLQPYSAEVIGGKGHRPGDECEFNEVRQAQNPFVIAEAARKRFVERSGLLESVARHDQARWMDKLLLQKGFKYRPGGRAPGVGPEASLSRSGANALAIYGAEFRMLFQNRQVRNDSRRNPCIALTEKRDVLSGCCSNPGVPHP